MKKPSHLNKSRWTAARWTTSPTTWLCSAKSWTTCSGPLSLFPLMVILSVGKVSPASFGQNPKEQLLFFGRISLTLPSATVWSWQRKQKKILRWKQKQEQGAREKEKELEEKYFKVCGLIFFGNKFSQHGSRSGEAGRTTMCFDTSSASSIDLPQSSQLFVPSNFISWTSMPWKQTLSSCNLVTQSSCHRRIRDIWGFLSDEIIIGFVGLFI